MGRECEHGYFMGKGCDACAEAERLQQAENNLIIKLQFTESVMRDQEKAIKEMVEASDKKCREALRAIIEEAAKHATDEEPWGWAWIHIVVTAKEALGLPAR